jgi:two-component sensor histidine kinase
LESLTLITNELVTNAAKYAFADRENGTVEIGYREEGAGWRLWVHDDGAGLPSDYDETESKSFGTQLVSILATRLSAHTTVKSDGGTKIEVFSGSNK